MLIPSRIFLGKLRILVENANGMKSTMVDIYTAAHTKPKLSGLKLPIQYHTFNLSSKTHSHQIPIHIKQVPSIQLHLTIPKHRRERRYQVYRRHERNDGEPQACVERRDRGHGLEEGARDEPGGNGEEGKEGEGE